MSLSCPNINAEQPFDKIIHESTKGRCSAAHDKKEKISQLMLGLKDHTNIRLDYLPDNVQIFWIQRKS